MASQAMHGASTFAAFGNVATCQLGARFGGEFRGFGKQGFWVTASSSARNQAPLPLPPDGGPRAPSVFSRLEDSPRLFERVTGANRFGFPCMGLVLPLRFPPRCAPHAR